MGRKARTQLTKKLTFLALSLALALPAVAAGIPSEVKLTLHEILTQATSDYAELFVLSGKRHPHQEGRLGVIREDAYADLPIVDGNPLPDISLLADPEKNSKLIMKDGKTYKITLH